MKSKTTPAASVIDTESGLTIYLDDGADEPQGRRTKFTHPYSYDPIVQWSSGQKYQSVVYTDRLKGWYPYEKLQELKKKHFGNAGDYWSERKPAAIQAFLRELFNKPSLQLHFVEEHCNVANGFPVWLLGYNETAE